MITLIPENPKSRLTNVNELITQSKLHLNIEILLLNKMSSPELINGHSLRVQIIKILDHKTSILIMMYQYTTAVLCL